MHFSLNATEKELRKGLFRKSSLMRHSSACAKHSSHMEAMGYEKSRIGRFNGVSKSISNFKTHLPIQPSVATETQKERKVT